MNKADRIRRRGKKSRGLIATLTDIQDQSGDRDFLSFHFTLESGEEVTRQSPALLSDHSVTWKLISGIMGTKLTPGERQWVKARDLSSLVGRRVLVHLAKKADKNGQIFKYVSEVFPA